MKAAFGRVNLTPDDYLGRTLAGYTPIVECKGKYDDIYGTVFLLEDNTNYLIFITMDFLKLPIAFTNYIKKKIQKQFGIPPENILIHATHTHKSFDQGGEFHFSGGFIAVLRGVMFGSYYADDKYNVWITKHLLDLISKIKSNLKECRIAWKKKKIEDNLIINRRHPRRLSKSDLGIIVFENAKTKDNIGTIVTYSSHPTSLNFSINKLSADYPGRVVAHLEDISKNMLNVAYFTAPCADINPITTCGTEYDKLTSEPNSQFNENEIYQQYGTYEHTTKLGFTLAEKAYMLFKSLKKDDYVENPRFSAYLRKFYVPMKDFTKYKSKVWLSNRLKFIFKKLLLIQIPVVMSNSKKPNFPGFSVERRNRKIVAETAVQYVKIGSNEKNISITGIPGELFEDIAEEMYENSPLDRESTFIFQNSNDWIGYLLPLKEYIADGGYEAFTSFTPLAGEYIRKNYYELLKEAEHA
jgi:co-chaperonin GroES (HSP10)